jgi:hypothetical protein
VHRRRIRTHGSCIRADTRQDRDADRTSDLAQLCRRGGMCGVFCGRTTHKQTVEQVVLHCWDACTRRSGSQPPEFGTRCHVLRGGETVRHSPALGGFAGPASRPRVRALEGGHAHVRYAHERGVRYLRLPPRNGAPPTSPRVCHANAIEEPRSVARDLAPPDHVQGPSALHRRGDRSHVPMDGILRRPHGSGHVRHGGGRVGRGGSPSRTHGCGARRCLVTSSPVRRTVARGRAPARARVAGRSEGSLAARPASVAAALQGGPRIQIGPPGEVSPTVSPTPRDNGERGRTPGESGHSATVGNRQSRGIECGDSSGSRPVFAPVSPVKAGFAGRPARRHCCRAGRPLGGASAARGGAPGRRRDRTRARAAGCLAVVGSVPLARLESSWLDERLAIAHGHASSTALRAFSFTK